MEFDSSFATNFPHLFVNFPENRCTKLDVSTTVHVKPNSILPPHPSHNITFLYQNNNHQFQSHPLNGANHISSIPVESLYSSSPSCMTPTPMSDFVSAGNPVTFAPNHNKIEGTYGYPDNSKNLLDFSQTNPSKFGMIFEPQVRPFLSPSLLDDAHAFAPVNLKFQDELSCILGTEGDFRGTDQKLVAREKQPKSLRGKNNENQEDDTDITKGQWTAEEDRVLTKFVKEFGLTEWAKIARLMKLRSGKQCRERWTNHLRPNITKKPWNEEEEKLLIAAHKIFGNQWSKIAKRLPWRSENSIKNHWNITKRRLNSKRKKRTHNDCSKGTLLSNYIKEVIFVEGDENEMKKPMSTLSLHSEEEQSHNKDLGSINVLHERSEGDFSSKYWTTQEDEVCGSVPMMLKVDKMASGSGVMDYELGMEMFLDDPMKKEMDLLDMIYLNP